MDSNNWLDLFRLMVRMRHFERAAYELYTANSSLWRMENVIISPHVARLTSRYYEVVLDLFSANLRRYIAGEPLLNQVWPAKS